MSAIERIGLALMAGDRVKLVVRSDGPLVMVVSGIDAHRMTVTEARAWRDGLSRAIRQADAAARNSTPTKGD